MNEPETTAMLGDDGLWYWVDPLPAAIIRPMDPYWRVWCEQPFSIAFFVHPIFSRVWTKPMELARFLRYWPRIEFLIQERT